MRSSRSAVSGAWLLSLGVAAVALAGCHLLYPFTAGSPDGAGPGTDGAPTDQHVLDHSHIADGLDASIASERGDCCAQADQPRSSCPDGAPLVLTPVSPDPLLPATQAFNATCKAPNKLTGHSLYALGACPAGPQVDEVAAALLSGTQGSVTDQNGSTLTLAQLQGSFFFKTTLCTGGPALLTAVASYCGGSLTGGWYGEAPVPCHNCTQFDVLAVILCPAGKQVVVLKGTYGWDS